MAYPNDILGLLQQWRDTINTGNASTAKYTNDEYGVLQNIRDLINTGNASTSQYPATMGGLLQNIRDLLNTGNASTATYPAGRFGLWQAIRDFGNTVSASTSGYPASVYGLVQNVVAIALLGGGGGVAANSLSFLPAGGTTAPFVSPGYVPTLAWERTQAWTAIAKINVAAKPAAAAAGIIFTTCNQSTGNVFAGYELWLNDQGQLQVRVISNFGSSNYIGVHGGTNVCDGVTRTVAASYDGSSTVAGVKIYVNGVLETMTSEGTSLSASIIAKQPFFIGNQKGWPYSLGGTLSEFSLSNVVRSQATIAAYTTALAAKDVNTVLAYNFTENTGKATADISGNGFNGSVVNATWPSALVGRAPWPVQGGFDVDVTTSKSSTSMTQGTAARVGSTIILTAVVAAASGTLAFSDDKGNSYTVVQTNSSLAGVLAAQAIAVNVTNGPTVFTASGATGTFWRLVQQEVGNIVTSLPVDGKASLYSASTGTGTDAVTSGNLSASPSVNFDFIYAVEAFGTGTVSTGTGFTPLETAATDIMVQEYKVQPVAAAIAATYTQSLTSQNTVLALALKSL